MLLRADEVRGNQTASASLISLSKHFQHTLGTSVTLAAFIVFAVAAGYSHFHEIRLSRARGDHPSDPIWGIMKFVFMWFFVGHTLKWPLALYFQGITMPGLFFQQGIVNQGRHGFVPSKLMFHMLADTVLNNLIWSTLVLIFTGAVDFSSLWFLWALAAYHLFAFTLYKVCRVTMGSLLGGAFCVSGLSLLPNLFWQFLDLGYEPSEMVVSVLGYSMWYVLGLAVNRSTMMRVLQSKVAFVSALALLSGFLWGIVHNPKINGIDFMRIMSFNESTAHAVSFGPLQIRALHVVSKTLLMLAVTAFVAPLSCVNAFFPLGSIVARMGQRAMICYWAHMLVCKVTQDLPQLTMIASQVNSVAGLTLTLVVTVVLCSPASELCFGWAASPWWLLDVLASQLSFEKYRSFLRITNRTVITKNPSSKTPFGDRRARPPSRQNYGASSSGSSAQDGLSSRSNSSSPAAGALSGVNLSDRSWAATTGMNMADRPWPSPATRQPEPPMQGYPF